MEGLDRGFGGKKSKEIAAGVYVMDPLAGEKAKIARVAADVRSGQAWCAWCFGKVAKTKRVGINGNGDPICHRCMDKRDERAASS